jgi:hypothetical protein
LEIFGAAFLTADCLSSSIVFGSISFTQLACFCAQTRTLSQKLGSCGWLKRLLSVYRRDHSVYCSSITATNTCAKCSTHDQPFRSSHHQPHRVAFYGAHNVTLGTANGRTKRSAGVVSNSVTLHVTNRHRRWKQWWWRWQQTKYWNNIRCQCRCAPTLADARVCGAPTPLDRPCSPSSAGSLQSNILSQC